MLELVRVERAPEDFGSGAGAIASVDPDLGSPVRSRFRHSLGVQWIRQLYNILRSTEPQFRSAPRVRPRAPLRA